MELVVCTPTLPGRIPPANPSLGYLRSIQPYATMTCGSAGSPEALKSSLDPSVEYQKGWNARQFAEDMGKAEMAEWLRRVGG